MKFIPKRLGRFKNIFITAAVGLSVGIGLCAGKLAMTFRASSAPVQYDPQTLKENIKKEDVLHTLNALGQALEQMRGRYIPAPFILLHGNVPPFIMKELRSKFLDGSLDRKELIDSLIAAGLNLPHDLSPDEDVLAICAEILKKHDVQDKDGSFARGLANGVLYICAVHADRLEDLLLTKKRNPAPIKGPNDLDEYDNVAPLKFPVPVLPVHVAVIGDSLAAGALSNDYDNYPQHLELTLKKRGWNISVDNLGKEGAASDYALKAVSEIISKGDEHKKPDLVVLALGGNDILMNIRPDWVQSNLEQAIVALKNNNIDVMLCGMQAPPWYPESYKEEFDAIYTALASKYDLVVDPFIFKSLVRDKDARNLSDLFDPAYMADFIHPNSAGLKRMSNDLVVEVEEALLRTSLTIELPKAKKIAEYKARPSR